MRIRLFLILCLLGTISCGDFRQRWSDWYEYKFSNNSVYWTNEETITPDLFIGEKGDDGGCYSDYFGVTVLWDIGDILKFNVRIFFDKKKSWMKPESEWTNYSIMPKSKRLNYQGQFSQLPKLLKLKFDYLECGARQLRKYLKENPGLVKNDNISSLVDSYWDKAILEWKTLQEELGDDISDSKLKPIRELVDKKLEELSDFDPRVNSNL